LEEEERRGRESATNRLGRSHRHQHERGGGNEERRDAQPAAVQVDQSRAGQHAEQRDAVEREPSAMPSPSPSLCSTTGAKVPMAK
jgi:hypothetical protein